MKDEKSILIIGGLGFIGKNLTEGFLNNGKSVAILDLPGINSGDSEIENAGRFRVYRGSFSDKDLLRKIFAENNIEVVLHLASTTVPATSNKDMAYDIHSNLEGAVSLLEEMHKASVSKIVYFSSGGTVYGSGTAEHMERGFKESDPTSPISSHGIVKLAVEKYLELYRHLYGIDYLILRVSNPYGPHHRSEKQGFINVVLRNIKSGKPVTVWGDGSVIRDFIYVKDISRILLDLLDRNIWNRVFNLGSGKGYSVKEIIDLIKSEAGSFEVFYEPTRAFDVPRAVLDISEISKAVQAASELTGIKGGISETYKWLNENGLK
jgi:UDP-glucose 4-epimerase